MINPRLASTTVKIEVTANKLPARYFEVITEVDECLLEASQVMCFFFYTHIDTHI